MATRTKTFKFDLIGKYQDEALDSGKTNSSWVDYSVIAYDEQHARELFESETGEDSDEYHIEENGIAATMINGQYFEPRVVNNNEL